MSEKIKVLIVEDSPVVQLLLAHILGRDPGIEVAGTCADGAAAVLGVAAKKPDVVLMDVNMPVMDGFQATRLIMESTPVPIIICSAALKRDEVGTMFRALEAGAVAFVDKPPSPGHPLFTELVAKLIETVKMMAGVTTLRRRNAAAAKSTSPAAATHSGSEQNKGRLRIVVIGASTGGPAALHDLLAELPAEFPLPILVVQHIAAGFLSGMADWLSHATKLRVVIATDGVAVLPGSVYLAPDDVHMGITNFGRIMLSNAPPDSGLRPSAAFLFRSARRAYGPATVAVVLSGMGRDGADELKLLRDCGAVTFAQDKDSSVIHGMPGTAIALGAAKYVLPPARIAATLALLAQSP